MTAPSTEWTENVAEGEDAQLVALAEELRAIQMARAARAGAARGLHAKGHVGARATLTIADDLPPHARHGLFARAATYPALVRFSNGAGHHQHDRVGDVRGIAVKVLGVPGKKVIPGLEDARTQDFLLIQSTSTPFRNAREFVALVAAATGSPLLLLPRFAARVGLGRAISLVRALLADINAPFPTFAGRRMYSGAAIRVGPYAARYALLPSGETNATPLGADLASDLAARLAVGPLAWDLALQFFVDERSTPIEDASAEWKESDAPFVRVARLELPAQDVLGEEGKRRTARIETLSFDPWHALVEHRPLGHVMRARNHAYRLSTQARGAAPEPDGDE